MKFLWNHLLDKIYNTHTEKIFRFSSPFCYISKYFSVVQMASITLLFLQGYKKLSFAGVHFKIDLKHSKRCMQLKKNNTQKYAVNVLVFLNSP